MKKLSDIIKPVISIVFGVLLFLVYMNWLQDGAAGGAIANASSSNAGSGAMGSLFNKSSGKTTSTIGVD